jgi:O-acetyl-ADP-ribose deacetylase (regulator of RNase III)
MRSLKIFTFGVFFLFVPSLSNAEPSYSVQIGNSRFGVVLGDLTAQAVDAIVVSHWPETVNDEGGVGGAVAGAGGQAALEQFKEIMIRNGGLQHTQVFPISLSNAGRLQAGYIYNVVELAPRSRILFDTVEELDASSFPFTAQERRHYRELLTQHQATLAESKVRTEQARKTLNENSSEENWRAYLQIVNRGTGSDFEEQRRKVVEPHEKQIGYETVIQTTYNVLDQASKQGLKKVAFPTLSYGIMGDLAMPESVAAIAAGVRLYNSKNPQTAVPEVYVVVYGRDNAKNRKDISRMLGPVIGSGAYLSMAAAQLPHWSDFDWRAARATHEQENPDAYRGGCLAVMLGWFGW